MKDTGIYQYIWEIYSSKLSSNSLRASRPLRVSRKCLYEISPCDKEPKRAFTRPFPTFPSQSHYSKIRYITPPINGNPIKVQLNKIVFLLCLTLVKRKCARKYAVRKDFSFFFFFQKTDLQVMSWGQTDTDQSSVFFIVTTKTLYGDTGHSKWFPQGSARCSLIIGRFNYICWTASAKAGKGTDVFSEDYQEKGRSWAVSFL